MQRFLTDSPWDDEVIIGRLQEYLGTRLEHPEGVWVLQAQVTFNGLVAEGKVFLEKRGEKQSSAACLAWSETWVRP